MDNIQYILLVIVLMGCVTWGLRAVPFFFMEFFKHHPIIGFLGVTLPGCVMLILVVFSVKDVHFLAAPYGVPELLGIAATAAVHLWRRNVFISIVLGTAVYAVLAHCLPYM